jgi:predicted RNA-binding Zn-ribbon protein involved in translation (DUF1610 family)
MALVRAVCTACGSNLEVDDKKDAAICPYCGSAYIVEKARDIYLTNNAKIENIHAETINIGKNDEDRLYESAEALIKLGKTKDALDAFQKMTNDYPYDYRGWWGLAKAESKGLSLNIPEKAMISALEHMGSAIKVAPDNIGEDLKEKSNKYKDTCIGEIKSRLKALPEMKSRLATLNKSPKYLSLTVIISFVLAMIMFGIGIFEASNHTLRTVLMLGGFALVIIAFIAIGLIIRARNKNMGQVETLEAEINKLSNVDTVLDEISRFSF